MPIEQDQLADRFGAAVDGGYGTVFLGAGVSTAAGLPTWGDLVEEFRAAGRVPSAIKDLPLVVEYYVQGQGGDRFRLHERIREQVTDPRGVPGRIHMHLARLDVREFWTTNYDTLMEQALDLYQVDHAVVAQDGDVKAMRAGGRVVVKMHGSVNMAGDGWLSEPVITRGDYERYEHDRVRTWSLLTARYLSQRLLFLGFSFDDPNVELLLRLARTRLRDRAGEHLAVLTRPDAGRFANAQAHEEALRTQDLRVRDLELAGIDVCEIDAYADLGPLVEAVALRARPPRLFVSGSGDVRSWCREAAPSIADSGDWQVASLAGEAGWWTTVEVAAILRADGRYRPSRLRLLFRNDDAAAPPMGARVGTAIYTNLGRPHVYEKELARCRAMLVVGGGRRTLEEVEFGRDAEGVGVVPLAASGGAARDVWLSYAAPPVLGGRPADPATWAHLDHPDPRIAGRAAGALLRQAMFETA